MDDPPKDWRFRSVQLQVWAILGWDQKTVNKRLEEKLGETEGKEKPQSRLYRL